MIMKIGKAAVFNLDFRRVENIKCQNFEINRLDNYKEIEERVRKLKYSNDNIQTGSIIMDLSKYETGIEQKFTQDLEFISKLISFAQRRDVFFNKYIIEHDGKTIGPITKSIRTGKKSSIPIIRIGGLEEFLNKSLPLLKNRIFEHETRINRLLDFWHEAVLFTPTVFEVNIPLFFMSFEMIANTHIKNNPKLFMLDEDTWDAVSEKIKNICDDLGISGDDKGRLCGSIGFVKMGSAYEKIIYLLESMDLEHHSRDVNNIKNLRNDIIHGDDIKLNYGREDPTTLSLKCENLMGKIILHLFSYLDNYFVHSSFNRVKTLDAQI